MVIKLGAFQVERVVSSKINRLSIRQDCGVYFGNREKGGVECLPNGSNFDIVIMENFGLYTLNIALCKCTTSLSATS